MYVSISQSDRALICCDSCMFLGLSTAPEARGATSLNNKDHFPGGIDARPKSQSPPTSSQSTSPKRSGSLLRSSLSKKRSSSSRSSFFSRKSGQSFGEDSNLDCVPEGAILPSESQMRREARGAFVSSRSSRSTSGASGTDPKLVTVIKDGQTHWIPEAVVAQYLGDVQRPPSPPQYTVPQRSSMRRSRRPGMHISIPYTDSSPRPEDVCDAIPVQRVMRRPIHPLERLSYENQTPPALESDTSSMYSPEDSEVQSPLSQYESGKSHSSGSEVQTPKDGLPFGNRYFQVIDPAIDGVFDEANIYPSAKGLALGELQSHYGPPITPRSPPILPQHFRKRMTCESLLEPSSYIQLGRQTPCSDAKSINEMSLVASQADASAARQDTEASISAEAAESVIFAILSSVHSVEDLFHCALINKGFYAVYKRHEQALIENVFSSAALTTAASRQ